MTSKTTNKFSPEVRTRAVPEWTVERSGEILKHQGAPATFATSEEAKQAADLHMRDGFPNSKPVNDGLTWYNYRVPVIARTPTPGMKVSFF